MSFKNIFTQVAVLFIIILVGYFVRKKGLLDEASTSKLSSLVMNIFLPAMIITAMQIQFDKEMIPKILSLLFVSMVMFGVSTIVAFLLKLFIKSDSKLGIFQYALVFSNSGFMGYPVVEAVLGKGAIFYAAIFNLPFNFLCFTLGVYFLSKGNSNAKFSIKSMINPSMIAVFAADGIVAITTGIAITTESKLNGLRTKNTSTGIATSLKTANIYISNLLKHSIAEDPASIEPITIIERGVVTSPKSSNGWLINTGSSVPVTKSASPINTAIIEGFIIDFIENLALLFPFDKKYTPSVKQRKLKGRLKIAA